MCLLIINMLFFSFRNLPTLVRAQIYLANAVLLDNMVSYNAMFRWNSKPTGVIMTAQRCLHTHTHIQGTKHSLFHGGLTNSDKLYLFQQSKFISRLSYTTKSLDQSILSLVRKFWFLLDSCVKKFWMLNVFSRDMK